MTDREKLEGLLDELESAASANIPPLDTANVLSQCVRSGAIMRRDDARSAARKAILALFDAREPEPWVRIEPGGAMPAAGRHIHAAGTYRGSLFVRRDIGWHAGSRFGDTITHWQYATQVTHPDDVAAKGGG